MKKKSTPIDGSRFINFLSSVGMGLFLMFTIGIIMLISTFLRNIESSKDIIFNTLWFKLLLSVLCINILLSTVNIIRFKVWPSLSSTFKTDPVQFEKNIPSEVISGAVTSEMIVEILKKLKMKFRQQNNSFIIRSGALNYWGASVSHFGFVLLLLAGILGSFFIKSGKITLKEGETYENANFMEKSDSLQNFDFALECLGFKMVYYPDTQIPMSFESLILFSDKSGDIKSEKKIEVNKPVKFNGWKFYQADCKKIDNEFLYQFRISSPLLSEEEHIEVAAGETKELKGYKGAGIRLSDNLTNADIVLVNKSDLSNEVINNIRNCDWNVQVVGKRNIYITTLLVSKNYFIGLYYFSFTMMLGGILISFFIHRREIWILLDDKSGKVYIGGRYKNSSTFDKKSMVLIENLRSCTNR